MPIEDIWIDGNQYPCDEWASVESGEVLERKWEKGFDGGMCQFAEGSETGIYASAYVDVTSPPYLRVVGSFSTINSYTYPNLAALDMSYPLYAFYIESGTSGNEYVYLLNGRYGYKLDLDDSNALENRYDFGASAVCGRPTLFEDAWYISLGEDVDAVKLTAANCADSGGDTFTGLGYRARHFAVLPPVDDTGAIRLARAYNTNMVAYSADGTTWGSGFEVGESSQPINDLLSWVGELLVIRPDGPWKFDENGNARRFQSLIDLGQKSLTPKKSGSDDPYEGSNSLVHGVYAYWVDAAGLYRLLGQGLLPVGFEAAADYVNLGVSGADMMHDTDAWSSLTAWAQYVYGCNNRGIYQGRQLADGTIHWLSGMESPSGGSGSLRRAVVTEGKTSPLLWLVPDGTPQIVACFPLNQDGSLRADLGDARGGVGITALTYLPQLSFGRLSRQKQLRCMWAISEGLDSDNTFKFQYTRDRGTTPSDLGSEYSAAGFHEETWTPGTNDLCYEAAMVIWLKIAGGGTPADPRIRACGIQAVTPQVYRAVVPLREDRMRARMGVADALKNLRALKNAGPVAVREPGFRASFNGYVESITEQTGTDKDGQRKHDLALFIQRFDWTDDA